MEEKINPEGINKYLATTEENISCKKAYELGKKKANKENQSQLKEIRDKVEGLDSYIVPLILSEQVCVPLDKVLEILNSYIDGK